DQRFRRAEPHRARAGNRQRVRGRREDGGELAQPAEVGRIERPGPPDVRAVGGDGRQETAACHQAHARGSGRGPDPDAAPHRPPGALLGVDGEQRRKGLGERDKIRRDQALAYAIGAAGEDQLQLGGSRAFAPEREHTVPGNLTRHEDQFAVQHGLYDTGSRAGLAELSGVSDLVTRSAVPDAASPLPSGHGWSACQHRTPIAARRSRSSGVNWSATARARRFALTCSGRVAPNKTVVIDGLSRAKAIARLAGSVPTSRASAARSRPAATAGATRGWSSIPAARPAPGS